MKVLKIGKYEKPCEWRHKATCRQCGTKVELDQNDIRYATSYDYGGGCDVSYDWVCPYCPADNDVKNVPDWLKAQAYKKWVDNKQQMVNMPRPKGFGGSS